MDKFFRKPRKEVHLSWGVGDKEFDLNLTKAWDGVKKLIADNKTAICEFIKELDDSALKSRRVNVCKS